MRGGDDRHQGLRRCRLQRNHAIYRRRHGKPDTQQRQRQLVGYGRGRQHTGFFGWFRRGQPALQRCGQHYPWVDRNTCANQWCGLLYPGRRGKQLHHDRHCLRIAAG